MGIKSQQDIKNESKIKSDKIPKSMESKAKENPSTVKPNEPQPIIPLIQRVEAIEEYLSKVDQAFEKIVLEIENLKNLIKITQIMDNEISKITGDIVRLTKLEEDRYIELATAINGINEKLTIMDEYIPVFIDKRLDDYFENLITETESSDEQVNDNQKTTQ